MTKIITDVQIKKLMKAINPKREWSEGCIQRLRADIVTLIGFLLEEVETNMVGNSRVKPQDIVDSLYILSNAIRVSKHPVLEHFVAEHKEILGGEE
tara:strand:- start:1274 stop:1561 length:288 start_codon:yes stop_codon:yes gene_type:complete